METRAGGVDDARPDGGSLGLGECPPAATPRALVRLNAIVAAASQAALALNDLDGRCASGPAFRSAMTCSTIAGARCWASASTSGAGLSVKMAW